MNKVLCPGFDGGNPLHMLASLGVFRLLVLRDQGARMRWIWEAGWRPEFFWNHGEEGESLVIASQWLAVWLKELGSVGTTDASLTRQVNTLKAEYKKLQEQRKEIAKSTKAEIRRLRLKGSEAKEYEKQATREIDLKIAAQQKRLAETEQRQNDALGQGIAHLGEVVGVPAPIFRRKATMAVQSFLTERKLDYAPRRDTPVLVVDALASQGSDGIVENGRVQVTPFSFSNGSSGQCLLKDFRKCAAACSEETVFGTMTGQPVLMKDITGLNWNPSDQRSYALQWHNPARGAVDDPAVNALAFVGLSLLPAIPVGGRLWATGWRHTQNGQEFVWPIWHEAVGVDEVRSLLAVMPSMLERSATERAARGIDAVFSATRINPTGKRNFFAPARPV